MNSQPDPHPCVKSHSVRLPVLNGCVVDRGRYSANLWDIKIAQSSRAQYFPEPLIYQAIVQRFRDPKRALCGRYFKACVRLLDYASSLDCVEVGFLPPSVSSIL